VKFNDAIFMGNATFDDATFVPGNTKLPAGWMLADGSVFARPAQLPGS
jgi:hypothetical protein